MTAHLSSKRQEEYLSRIALALSKRPALQGATPDDEDLAALLDNFLDPQRRAEVISHLAHDPALYRRWHRLLNDQDLWVEHNNVLTVKT